MRNRAAGTTLVELLVVMVVFLVGMLAMMQVFPGGLRILRYNRNQSVAVGLAREYMDWYEGRSDLLPNIIAAIDSTGAPDPTRVPNELGPVKGVAGLNQQGEFVDESGNVIGPWQRFSGANAVRMIVDQRNDIPAPRAVGSAYGSLVILPFAPIDNTGGEGLLQVYGNDMICESGSPSGATILPYQFYLANMNTVNASVLLPTDPNVTLYYRVSFVATVQNGGTTQQVDVLVPTVQANPSEGPVTVPPSTTGDYYSVSLATLLGNGAQFVSADPTTVQVQRMYEPVTSFSNSPYEYQVLDPELGVLLFNPVGYQYKVRQDQGAPVPLAARVNYDVLDWRILHEDLEVPSQNHPIYQLAMSSLAVKGSTGPDRLPNPGFPPSGSASYAGSDFLLVDLATGGVYSTTSYHVDKSKGIVSFIDSSNGSASGIQMNLYLPGATSSTSVIATGRSVRAFYQVNGEWTVQLLKAPAQYVIGGFSGLPGVGECLGTTGLLQFPWCDLGKKVTVGFLSESGLDSTAQADSLDCLITSSPGHTLPYIALPTTAAVPTWVKGASISVRVMWNPDFFTLTGDEQQNLANFNVWMQGWRRTETQTFLQRTEN
jgi:type II secretory pathway pseudopilin PulG